jgi:hypothetical protein
MITKLTLFKENNILVPRNLEQRHEKFKQQQTRLFQQEIITGDVIIDKDFYHDFTNIKTKKIIGNVDIFINKIPSWFKNIEIDGNFVCYNNGLITLEGSPQIVNGGFNCSRNKLTSFKGCPKYVGESFICSYNELTTLKYCPEIVNGDLFSCYHNNIKFTKGDVKKYCNTEAYIYN